MNCLTREVYKVMMKEIADRGVTLYIPPSDEAERWFERFKEETRNWVGELERKGLPGKGVVRIYNEECKKRGVKCVAFPSEWA